MDVVTHFVNDTVEFYKWSLSIAGKTYIYIFLTVICIRVAKEERMVENSWSFVWQE